MVEQSTTCCISHYRPENNTAYIRADDKAHPDLDVIAAHELGHSVESVFPVPPRQRERIESMQSAAQNWSRKAGHVTDPDEARGDVYALRYLANKLGVYDAGTQRFTPAHLAALQKAILQRGQGADPLLTRMLDVYGSDGFIELMNRIAKQENNTIPDNYA